MKNNISIANEYFAHISEQITRAILKRRSMPPKEMREEIERVLAQFIQLDEFKILVTWDTESADAKKIFDGKLKELTKSLEAYQQKVIENEVKSCTAQYESGVDELVAVIPKLK